MQATAEEQRIELLALDLESGEFTQAKGHLRTDDGMCCLGVACERYHRETGKGRWLRTELKAGDAGESGHVIKNDSVDWRFITGATGQAGEGGTLPEDVAEFYGFGRGIRFAGRYSARKDNPLLPLLGTAAASANDDGVPFTKIAAAFRDAYGPGGSKRYPG